MNRYQRQIVLDEIGAEGQSKLTAGRVLCVGAGGLGSPALLYLAAAGVGTIGIADFDNVDESNLQRQILFTDADLGRAKAKSAKVHLHARNPGIRIEEHGDGLNAENAESLFQAYDIIIDGTDNFGAKYLINDAAVKFGKPWVYGAIQKFEGQASVFDPERGPCYRCLYPHPPQAEVQNCADAGVIGGVAGIVGVTQAMQAIELMVGHESFEPLIGKLWMIDAKTMETRLLSFSRNPDCPVCSKQRDRITLHYAAPICAVAIEISPQQARDNPSALLIDVRELDEWQAGHIEGARNIPLSALRAGEIPDLPKEGEIILHCQRGRRSLEAAQILQNYGYRNVSSMAGGYEAWLQSGR